MKNIKLGIFFIVFFAGVIAKQMRVNKKNIISQAVPKKVVTSPAKVVTEPVQEPIAQTSQDDVDKKKGLLIFLDDSEKEFGAVSYKFLTALYQKVGPIIVSTSLLYNVLKKREEWALSNLKSRIAFQPEQWVIKRINESLSLLIPKTYLDDLKIDINKVKEFNNDTYAMFDIELQLGLKVNHMQTIDYMNVTQPSWAQFADYFGDSLDEIFCKNFDYKNKNMNIPEWFLFINGHGDINYAIVHLSFDGFKKLLHFLENKINTRLFVIGSCYVAGVNVDKVYGEIKLETQQYYSFPIIVQALNNVITYTRTYYIGLTDYDFVSFFKKAIGLEGHYSDIIKPISNDLIENTPQIKLPGIEWFSVLDADNKIVSIGSILAKTRDPEKPLNVVNFFKKNPELILLYADDIPFELIINSSRVKAVISMVSAKEINEDLVAVIRIKKISSTQSFYDVLDWFKLVGSSEGRNIFLIDEIGDYKDILIVGSLYDYQTQKHMFRVHGDMMVFYKDKNDDLFFGEKRTGFMRIFQLFGLKKLKIEKVEKGSSFENFYQEKLDMIRNQYPKASAVEKEARQEISSEQIKKIENVLIKKHEKQKELVTKNPIK
jgi:hypothetical protein